MALVFWQNSTLLKCVPVFSVVSPSQHASAAISLRWGKQWGTIVFGRDSGHASRHKPEEQQLRKQLYRAER
jgi:hypothetical protein